jgi:hypothetical protein
LYTLNHNVIKENQAWTDMNLLTRLIIVTLVLSQTWGISEFDELAHQIIDDIRANRPLTATFVESWYDHGDPGHIQSVCDAFNLPQDIEHRRQEVQEIENLLVEHKEPKDQARFHQLMRLISPEKQEPITLLLMNYMIGIPE